MASILGGFAGLGGGSIGRASVDLVLNAGAYTEQLAAAEGKTKAATAKMGTGFSGFQQRVKSSFSSAQVAMVGFGAVAVAAIGKAVGTTQTWAAEVRSLQRVTGQTAEQASQLAAAGESLGIDVTKLNTGFGLLAKNIVNNSANLTKYGIATKDAQGNILPFDQVLAAVSDKFATLTPGAEQTAFAMNVFGRSGKDLIPILQRGSEGLQELYDNAKAAGLVMSQDDLNAAKELSLAQRELGEAFKGAAVRLGTTFLPFLTQAVQVFTQLVEVIQHIPKPLLAIATGFIAVQGAVVLLTKAFGALQIPKTVGFLQQLWSVVLRLAGGFENLAGAAALAYGAFRGFQELSAFLRGDLAGAFNVAQSTASQFIGTASGIPDVLGAFGQFDQTKGDVEGFQIAANQLTDSFKAGAISTDQFKSGIQQLGEQFGVHIDDVDGFVNAVVASRDATTGAGDAASGAAPKIFNLADAHKRAADAAKEQRTAEAELAGGFVGMIASLQQLRTDQATVNELKRKGKQGSQEYADAVLQELQDQQAFSQSIKDVAQNMIKAGATTKDVKQKVYDLGRQAGLSKSDITALFDSVKSGSKDATDNVTGLSDALGKLPAKKRILIEVGMNVEANAQLLTAMAENAVRKAVDSWVANGK